MKANRSIRAKLITLYVAILTLVFVCFGIYIYAGFKTYLIHSLQQTLTWRAEQIAATFLKEIPVKGEAFVGNEIQTRYAPELNPRGIRVTDVHGHQVYGSKIRMSLTPAARTRSKQSIGECSRCVPGYASNGERLEVITVSHRINDGSIYTIKGLARRRLIFPPL